MAGDNSKTNQKIGRLIYETRQQRGLTQLQLAELLGTSQSAVNRIEKGHQNLSLTTLARLSDALKRPVIAVNKQQTSLRVNGGRCLSGQVTLNSAKNSVVGLLMASILNHGKTILKRAPRIEEVLRLVDVLESIGVKTRWLADNDLEIKRPAKLTLDRLDEDAARLTRSAIMLIGPLLKEESHFKIPFAGGCRLGQRTISGHAYALKELGIEIDTDSDTNQYHIRGQLQGRQAPIVMYESGDTATENILMAAASVDQTTIIKMASGNYQVQDMCVFLQQLGIKVKGIGTTTLTIDGTSQTINKTIEYSPSEDPVEAMTFIAAAITTNSNLTINRAPIEFLELELYKLSHMGLKYNILQKYQADNGFGWLVDLEIKAHDGQLQAPINKIAPRPFPGLNIDHLPYFVPIAATANGSTLIHDWVYENRALYYTDLANLGANVQLADAHRVWVHGPTRWQATDMICPPALRPASIILIGMLAANGTSTLRNIYTINRGYENIAYKLQQLGADVEVLYDIT